MNQDISPAPADATHDRRNARIGRWRPGRGAGKIAATRKALERALEAADSDELRTAIARLDRIEAEVAAVERKVVGRVGVTFI